MPRAVRMLSNPSNWVENGRALDWRLSQAAPGSGRRGRFVWVCVRCLLRAYLLRLPRVLSPTRRLWCFCSVGALAPFRFFPFATALAGRWTDFSCPSGGRALFAARAA